jgi:hypothetical protein
VKHGYVYADQHHSVATCGNVILTYSAEPPNPDYLAAWDRATGLLAARTRAPIAVITIIDGNSSTPDEPSRKAIRDTISTHRNQISALAYVVEGRGFASAAMRSVLSVLSLAARYPFPQKVFSSVGEAAQWVARTNGASVTSANLVSAVETMRGEVRLAAAG